MPSDYHHGDLPAALRSAAVELIAERGPAGFSLREVARRAGVSHAAPAHHFGDTRGLLTAVATEGFEVMSDAMLAATLDVTDSRERVVRCGRSYVNTALANPGHYSVMITHGFTDENDVPLLEASLRAYAILLDTVNMIRDQHNPELDVDSTATLMWATVHGLVEMAPVLGHVAKRTQTNYSTLDDLLERFTDLIFDGVRQPADVGR